MGLGDERPHLHASGFRRPDFQAAEPRAQRIDELIRQLIPNRHRDRNRHAAFAGRAIRRSDKGLDGRRQVRIRHDHHVILGAPEGLHPLAGRHRPRLNLTGDGRRADETHGRDPRVIQNGLDGDLVALNDVEYARGETRRVQELGQADAGGRVALGRL